MTEELNLTIEQKIEVLKEARKYILKFNYFCMCTALSDAICKFHTGEYVFLYSVFSVFPELLKYKPKRIKENHLLWFKKNWIGKTKRIIILTLVIRQLKKQLQKKQVPTKLQSW